MKHHTARWRIAMGSLIASALAGTSMATTVTVDPSTTYQTMDGFGACDNWCSAFSNDALGTFFNKDTGIGLSILRMGINSSGGNGGSWANAKYAAGQGAILWGAPWTPPANEKSGNSTVGNKGGYLLPSSYNAWATTLAGFAAATKSNTGVDLYGISAQNEPDYSSQVTYDGCVYSNDQMASWVQTLGPKLHALNPPVKLIAPESFSWKNLAGFANAIMGNSTANSAVDIFATHDYEHGAVALPNAGRHIWETEVSSFDGPSSDIGNGLTVAGWIHNGIVVGGANAWHYWWLSYSNNDNEDLIHNGVKTKRLYTMGNYSKFIRPGFVRISATTSPTNGVSVSAFASPSTFSPRQIVVVAINTGSTDNQEFSLTGVSADSAIPWVTDANNNLKKQTPVSMSNSAFTANLGANSVTSFVIYLKSTSLGRQEAEATRVEDVQLLHNGSQPVLSIGPAEQPGQVRVLDLSGREVASASILSGRSDIPLPGLRSGIYAVVVKRGDVAVTKSLILP